MAKAKTKPVDKEPKKEKHAGGRPPIFKTPKEMSDKIEAYFLTCWPNVLDDEGKVNDRIAPPILEEMIYEIGLTSYQSLINYRERNEGFSEIVTRAKAKCGYLLNKSAMLKNVDSRIASLNLASNYGIHEKKEIVGELPPSKIIVEFV